VRKLATADRVPQDQVSALEGVQQVPLREEVTGSGPPPAGSTPRPGSSCPAAAPRPSAPTARPRRAPTRGARCPAAPAATSTRTEPPSRPRDLHRPDIRHQAALRAIVSAQVRLLRREKLQASSPTNQPGSNCGPTQACLDPGTASRQAPGARIGARLSSRGERDAHEALPKRLHEARPGDSHLTRSLHRLRAEFLDKRLAAAILDWRARYPQAKAARQRWRIAFACFLIVFIGGIVGYQVTSPRTTSQVSDGSSVVVRMSARQRRPILIVLVCLSIVSFIGYTFIRFNTAPQRWQGGVA